MNKNRNFLRANFQVVKEIQYTYYCTIIAEKSKNIFIFLYFMTVRAGNSLFVVPDFEYPPVYLFRGGEL